MPDPWDESELARRFRESAVTSQPRAPLYAALSDLISRDRALSGLLLHAPPTQRLPVLLFACVHDLLLADADRAESQHELVEWYPNLTPDPRPATDPGLAAAFGRFVDERSPDLLHLLATRTTQTNEVGRCLLLLPALGRVADDVGPLALVDVGCSGGLTLLIDRYRAVYTPEDGSADTVLGPESSVELPASTRGDLGLPARMPVVAARCGIDVAPIDVTDDDEARWLEACVWPDQTDRFQRLRAAIAIARADPPELITGDAVSSIAGVLDRFGSLAHPVVTNTWVLNYLEPGHRRAYVDELDRIGAERELSWVYVEAPALTPELPWEFEPDDPHLTVTTLARWRDGVRHVEHLATSHPHGYWIHAR